jgi:death-on-curing protein
MIHDIQFLSVDQLLAIHQRGITEHGGTPELRDRGLLESAAAMPYAQFGGQYLHDGLPAMAAAYLFQLCKNQPFVDGNKRVAVAAAEVFVLLNERELKATNAQLELLTLGVADGSISKVEATTFFKKHVRRKQPRTRKVPKNRK